MRRSLGLFLALLGASPAYAGTVFVSALDLAQVDSLRFPTAPPPKPDVSVTGGPIRIGGRKFGHGLATRGITRMEIALDGAGVDLHAWTGVTDDSAEAGPVWFEIVGDGRMLYAGEPIARGQPPREVSVPLAGVKDLVLLVQSPDHLDTFSAWGGATIEFAGAAPRAVAHALEPPYPLTPPPPSEPGIHGAVVFGVRPGHPVLYTIAATGIRPMRFSAVGLPPGLSLDPVSGQITGAVGTKGDYEVTLGARNARGAVTRTLRLVVGDTLALTPPMGWNSWNCFGQDVNAADIRAAAEGMVRSGLAQHGWTYVNIDDYWMTRPPPSDPVWAELARRARAKGLLPVKIPPDDDPTLRGRARDSAGRIQPNRRFPDLAGLVAEIHALGLRAGIYSSPGPLTCGRCTGSFQHESDDAAQFAAWGFDYLKYDWCTYRYLAPDGSRAELERPYRAMARALRAQPRDIVFSLCQYGQGDVWTWGGEVGGNLWRTTRDIVDSWPSMSGIGFSQDGPGADAGPGRWNDPDMLVVGRVGWGRGLHPTALTPDEQYTHVSLWSLLAAPLLIGCDLAHLDPFTRGLLTNDEVIAVDQDPLGRPARRVMRRRDVEVWARPLADGAMAVGLFNRGELPADVTARWSELGLSGAHRVRDLWRQRNLGTFADQFTALVPRHGVTLVRIDAVATPPEPVAPSAASFAAGQTDVFVAGQGGYHSYRIPAVIRAADGTLLAFCEGRKDSGGDAGNIDLLLRRSADGGRSWGSVQVLWDDGPNTCGNPCPVVDRSTGTIWLLATHNLGLDHESALSRGRARGTRTVWVLHSDDQGAHWSAPAEITADVKDPAWTWYATGPGIGIQLRRGPHAGRLVVPCDHSRVAANGEIVRGSHVIYSDDDGRTWHGGGVVEPGMNECQVAELPGTNGTLLLNMRSYRGHHCRAEATSDDGGTTWSPARDATALVDPVCQGSVIADEASGLLLFSNPADPRRRVRMTVRASADGAKTWSPGLVLHDGPAAYSCLVALGDHTAGCLYELGQRRPYERIAFARFSTATLIPAPSHTP
ncbi:MAG TPA: exo-alpha-sialidase [Opitutaceae bacterium]|nr:exo-alpha-sialidase [Opitutaceae bacterium]